MCIFFKGKLTSDLTMLSYGSMEKRGRKFSKYTMWVGQSIHFSTGEKKNQEYKSFQERFPGGFKDKYTSTVELEKNQSRYTRGHDSPWKFINKARRNGRDTWCLKQWRDCYNFNRQKAAERENQPTNLSRGRRNSWNVCMAWFETWDF